MGQSDVFRYIKENKNRCDITIVELVEHFNVTQSNMNRIVKRLRKFKEILITVDGRRHLIRINPEVLKDARISKR